MPPTNLVIRPEVRGDADGIRAANIAIFSRPVHPTEEADMVDELRANGKAILSLVAELDGRVVGHILFSPLRFEPELPPMTGIALGPLGVVPELQRQGIGSALTQAGLETCREMGYGSVFLYGHPTYYPRLGFQPARVFGVSAPTEPRDPDAFMAIELREGALSAARGCTAFEEPDLS